MTERGGASTSSADTIDTDDGRSGSQGPVEYEVTPQYDLVEWRQANLTEFFEREIDTMEKAVSIGQQLIGISERVEIGLGLLFNHVEKHKGGRHLTGGARELGRQLDIPHGTYTGWMVATKTEKLVERSASLGTSKVEVIERAPDPEPLWEWMDSQEEPPPVSEVRDRVSEQRMEKFYERLDERLETRVRPDPLYYTNVWYFPNARQDYDKSHGHGIAFSEVLEHILYYFTSPGDLVIDPMAGTGPSKRVCDEYGRRCLMYDIETKREDIVFNDLTRGLPEEAQGCDHIYLDPPYFNMRVKGAFNDDLEEFYEFIRTIGQVCHDALGPDGTLSLVMMDKWPEGFIPLISECYRIFREIGFECIGRISSPYPEHISATGAMVNHARENRRLICRDRVIFVFRRAA